MAFQITHDTVSSGFALFDGPKKIAVVHTMQEGAPFPSFEEGTNKPISKTKMEPMPRSSWNIHFTSPILSIDLLEAIVAVIPKDDSQTHVAAKQAH